MHSAMDRIAQRSPRPQWPFAAHEHAFRVIAAIPLAVVIAAWSVWANLTQDGDPRWLPYLPLLNPLDISMALGFVSVALWWASLSSTQRSICWSGDPRILIAIAAGVIFLWLNAALIRALHHNFGAPLTAYGIAHSTLVQASLSIFWGVLGFAAMMLACPHTLGPLRRQVVRNRSTPSVTSEVRRPSLSM